MAVFGREAAADVEGREWRRHAVADPVGRGQRPLVGVGILDLAADMEGDADLVAVAVQAVGQLDGMGRRGTELLGQLVGGRAAGLDAHEDGERAGVDVERAHHTGELGHLVLMVDGDDADAVALERQADVGLRLDRMHVEHLGLRRDGAHRLELGRRGDVEGGHARLCQSLEDDAARHWS